MLRAFAILLIVLAMPAHSEQSFCNERQVNQEWYDLLAKSPNDHLLIKLLALRSGLCAMIEQELVGVQLATEIFEAERAEAISQRRSEGGGGEEEGGI